MFPPARRRMVPGSCPIRRCRRIRDAASGESPRGAVSVGAAAWAAWRLPMRPRQYLMHHWAMPVVAAAIATEIAWYLLVQRRVYPWREMAASVAIRIMHIPLRFLTPLVVGPAAYFAWSHRLVTVPLDTAWGVALLVLGEEFVYYWAHRAGHEVRWVWASHVVHHTP